MLTLMLPSFSVLFAPSPRFMPYPVAVEVASDFVVPSAKKAPAAAELERRAVEADRVVGKSHFPQLKVIHMPGQNQQVIPRKQQIVQCYSFINGCEITSPIVFFNPRIYENKIC